MTDAEREAQDAVLAVARKGTAYNMMRLAAGGNSRTAWVDINQMMHKLLWMIVVHVKPALYLGEVVAIYNDFDGGHWFGDDGSEELYATAIQSGHDSAPPSIEHFLDRAPFWIEEDGEKHRLFVGRVFTHQGEQLRVTSFFGQGVRCVREGKDVKAGVVELLREGLEAEREAIRQKRLAEAKSQREAARADPVAFKPLRDHLADEAWRLGHKERGFIDPAWLGYADKYGTDYKQAYAEIPCTHALCTYLKMIGLRSDSYTRSDPDQVRKNYPWSKVEQHLFKGLRRLRGLPLRDGGAS